MFDAVAAVMPHVKAGKIKLLAVTGAKRATLLPDVPTLAEAGVKGYAHDVVGRHHRAGQGAEADHPETSSGHRGSLEGT